VTSDKIRKSLHMRRKMDVNIVARRVSFEELQHGAELAVHVRLEQFTYIWFIFNID